MPRQHKEINVNSASTHSCELQIVPPEFIMPKLQVGALTSLKFGVILYSRNIASLIPSSRMVEFLKSGVFFILIFLTFNRNLIKFCQRLE